MINLPPADWKHIQAQIAAASKQSMHAGTHLNFKLYTITLKAVFSVNAVR